MIIDLGIDDTTRDQTLAVDHPIFEGLSESAAADGGLLRARGGSEWPKWRATPGDHHGEPAAL